MKKSNAKILAGLTAILVMSATLPVFPFSMMNYNGFIANAEETEDGNEENEETEEGEEEDEEYKVIASGKCGDDVTWEMYNKGMLDIKGSGAMYDYDDPALVPWQEYSDKIIGIIIYDDITHIGAGAFRELEEVNYFFNSENCVSIGDNAFQGCTNLKKLYYDNDFKLETIGEGAFENCENLSIVNLPRSLKSIDEYAFQGCTGLKTLFIESSDFSVKDTAFENCSSLSDIYTIIPPDKINWESNENSFMDDKATIFHVPAPYLEAYQSKFADMNVTFAGDIAVSGSCGENAEWEAFDTDSNGTFDKLVISGSGDMTDFAPDEDNPIILYDVPWYILRNEVRTVEIGKDITSIGKYAFTDFYDGVSITFEKGSSLASIGESAFEGSTFTSPFVIPDTVTTINSWAFGFVSGLESITIPKNVTLIDDSAFSDCCDLSSIVFEEGSKLERIGGWAFDWNDKLETVTIPRSVKSIGESVFYGCDNIKEVTFEEGSVLEEIGEKAFIYCESLESITIPKGVTDISKKLFHGCDNLRSVTFEDEKNIETIGDYAFYYCSNLEEFVIPGNVTSIGECAFYYSGLKEADLPESLTSIGEWAFGYCNNISEITIPEKVTSIPYACFAKCKGLTNVTVPKSVKSIEEYAFYECEALTKISIAKDSELETIGDGAFMFCAVLEGFEFPDGIKTIGEAAFCECESFKSLVIPASVTKICADAFYYVLVEDVYMYPDPSALEWEDYLVDDFMYDEDNTPDEHYTTRCHVPAEYLEAYKAKFSTGNEETDINVTFVSDDTAQTTSSTTTTTTTTTTATTTKADTSTSSSSTTASPTSTGGTSDISETTDLPQTGMPNTHKAAAGLAVIMVIMGTGMMIKSRKADEE